MSENREFPSEAEVIRRGPYEISVTPESVARRIAVGYFGDRDAYTIQFVLDMLRRMYGTEFLPDGITLNQMPFHVLDILNDRKRSLIMCNAIYSNSTISQNGVHETSTPQVQPVDLSPGIPATVLE